MNDYREFFKGKKITVMGLGLLGGAVNDIKFLAEQGAILTVTDLKSSSTLKSSLKELENYKEIKYVLGKHRLKDFQNADMILEPGNVPKDSIHFIEARKNKIPIFVSESMFAKYAPEITIVGVTGTRGKSMTTMLIYEILSKNLKGGKDTPLGLRPRVYLGGNIRGVSTLALLSKVRKGDIVVMELDSWALHGMGKIKKSPHIAVFTSFMPDHMNYYGGSMQKYFDDKANIFKYQKKNDFLVVRPHVKKLIKGKVKSKIIVPDVKKVADYKFIVPGEHQRENLSCAVEVAKLFKIPEANIRKTVRNFKGVEGRLQYVKSINGVKIFNDNNATTPEATIAGIRALCQEGNPTSLKLRRARIILISGGADKKLDLKLYVSVVNIFCKAVILIPGTGTEKLLKSFKLKVENYKVKSLEEAVKKSLGLASRGDVILFSPAFASFGMFNNEYERNDLFMKIVKKLDK